MIQSNSSGMKAISFLRNNQNRSVGRRIRRIRRRYLLLALLLGMLAPHAFAGSVTLVWDANQLQPDGYRLYHRTSGQSYDYGNWSCQTTGTSCTVNNLSPGTTYYFVVRAYVGGTVSGDSNEASHTTTAPAPSNHTISATAGSNGKITPSGEVSVSESGSQLFKITANTGYHISDVIVDGQSIGAVSSYQFTNITSHHRIEALFKQSNRNPNANAGSDQTVDGAVEVVLDGGGSNDPDTGDSIAGFQWRQVSGTSVQIVNAGTATARFTAPQVGGGGEALEFELQVTDQSGASATDRCIVNVTKDNRPPEADAGSQQQVSEGEAVVLNGGGSVDPDNDPIHFAWIQTLGPTVTLMDPQTAYPKFSAPDVGTTGATLKFELTVTDDKGLKDTDVCSVMVPWVNSPPKTDAGATQTAAPGQLIYLDGTGSSDPDGNIDKYQWTQSKGATVTLSDPSVSRPSFVAPRVDTDGATLAFELAVIDSEGLSSNDTCLVNVQSDSSVDTDGDGYSDNHDAFPQDETEWMDTDADGVGNNIDDDDDGDDMPDSWEILYGLDPLNSDDGDLDLDGDGLTNRIEAQSGTDPTQADTSNGWTPSVITPTDGYNDTSISEASIEIDTNDPEKKDTAIKQTLWQILSHDGQTVIFNIISDFHLSKIHIPRMILAPETNYMCRVRCYDSNDKISDWSPAIGFGTQRLASDSDLNGVPDDREVTIGKESQSTDALPTNLSLVQKTGIIFVDLISPSDNASLTSAMYIDPAEIEEAPDETLPTPFAMVANKIMTDPGEKVTLQIYFNSPQTPGALRWMKYDKVKGWQDYTENTILEDNARTMDVNVQDGGDGDADGVANGTIINMSGPAAVAGESNGNPSAAAGSEGQCFIRLMHR
jgi:hypothetical protein